MSFNKSDAPNPAVAHNNQSGNPPQLGRRFAVFVEVESPKHEAQQVRLIRANAESETFAKITQVLGELESKTGKIDQHKWTAAQLMANLLLAELKCAKAQYKMASSKAIEAGGNDFLAQEQANNRRFKEACTKAINKALPILERDLGWGDYLLNVLKTLISNVITLGARSNFFSRVPSQSAQHVEDAKTKLELR